MAIVSGYRLAMSTSREAMFGMENVVVGTRNGGRGYQYTVNDVKFHKNRTFRIVALAALLRSTG